MEAVLYAEVYAVCILVICVLLYWINRRDDLSFSELWIKRVYLSFLASYVFNLLFTVFNRIWRMNSLGV